MIQRTLENNQKPVTYFSNETNYSSNEKKKTQNVSTSKLLLNSQ